MTTTKWILCAIVASATSSYITFHLVKSSQNELGAASSIENSSHLKAPDIAIAEQHQESKTINNIHENHEVNINQIKPVPIDAGTNQPQQVKIEDLQFAYEKQQNEIALFREFTERTGRNSLSVINKNYDSEPVDPEWAGSKENELLALLSSNETLQNMTPLELSCKSQNCRLVLSARDENQGQSLYSAFKDEALKGSDENKKQLISYFNNPDRSEIQIYLSKSSTNALLNGHMD